MSDFDWDEEGEYDEDEDASIFEMDEQDERDMQEYGRAMEALDGGSDQEQLGGLPADNLDLSDIPF